MRHVQEKRLVAYVHRKAIELFHTVTNGHVLEYSEFVLIRVLWQFCSSAPPPELPGAVCRLQVSNGSS